MAVIGMVVHGHKEAGVLLAKETAEWLNEHGHHAEVHRTGPQPEDLPAPTGWDLAVSLGGDGTMLRTVDLVCADAVPVLGVNLGRLGYLTAVEPAGLRPALERFLAGDYQVEPRMTLDISFAAMGGEPAPARPRSALNDVVLQRTQVGHTMHTEVAVGGVPFLAFASDSLILATPTGSTAYNLSARGPIVSPRARVQVLTPVAPHMLFDRSLVLDADEQVSITVTGGQPVDVVVDGWHWATLAPGQSVHGSRGANDALLVTFGDRDFHQILKSKFDLKDR
ncbi:MAG TPA: NAD(+)/NADH kinase [Acidimicrobiales bacterium]|jgi:NAD+ kinase|nr:NAD(+)/NADH kinase [Acidimicrobiales bacterium]